MRVLRVLKLPVVLLPRLPLFMPPNERLSGETGDCCCWAFVLEASPPAFVEPCKISRPWRSVIISRIKQATAEAADPFSREESKRRDVAAPAACAASAMGSEVLAA